MPTAHDLVANLTTTANEWRALATAWHVFLGVLLVSLYMGWRPSTRLLAPMLVVPLLGVSIVAGLSGNAFNSSVFAVLALVLGALAFTRSSGRVAVASSRLVSIGAALVTFGAAYPHFVEAESWLAYAYAAPFGLVPCPTLAVVIGVSLMLDGLGSSAWSGVLAAAGIGYAIVGVAWFGIAIDLVLLAGALALAFTAMVTHASPDVTERPSPIAT